MLVISHRITVDITVHLNTRWWGDYGIICRDSGSVQRIRIDRESEAIHDLILLLNEPELGSAATKTLYRKLINEALSG